MPCAYCWEEGLTVAEHGSCPYCSREICTPPSARWDGDFHGETCGCGCGVLVCERHLRDHALQAHGRSDPGGCFPALWAIVTRGGLDGAASLLAGDSAGAPAELDRLLNVVLPRDSLLQVARALPARLASVERGGEADGWVRFQPEFYLPATVERAAALATREAMSAARGLGLHPERAAWVAARRTPHGRDRGGGVVDSAVDALSGIVERIEEALPSGRTRGPTRERVGSGPSLVEAAFDRHREVLEMDPGELAGWIAAPHGLPSPAGQEVYAGVYG